MGCDGAGAVIPARVPLRLRHHLRPATGGTMSDIITLTGIVATLPKAITTGEGLAITSFRLASSQRRFDRAQERWVDGDTNWYTVTAFRQLATNSAVSLK